MDRVDFFRSKDFNPINYVISSVLVYLREMFKHNDGLGYVVCEELDIDEPKQLSGLLIADKNTWDTKFSGHLPSIVLRRGPVSFGGGIQQDGMSRVINAGMALETATMEIVSVPMVLSCIARTDIEAESLAYTASMFLREDKRWAQKLGLYGINQPQIGPSVPYNPQESTFMCEAATSISVTKKVVTRLLPDVKLTELAIRLNQSPMANLKE